jgi:hypothetical protein
MPAFRALDLSRRSSRPALAMIPFRTAKERLMATQETGQVTGTKDKTYNLIWYTETCLDDALRLETYVSDAERDGDNEAAELFRKAQSDSRKGAEMGKRLLAARLGN